MFSSGSDIHNSSSLFLFEQCSSLFYNPTSKSHIMDYYAYDVACQLFPLWFLSHSLMWIHTYFSQIIYNLPSTVSSCCLWFSVSCLTFFLSWHFFSSCYISLCSKCTVPLVAQNGVRYLCKTPFFFNVSPMFCDGFGMALKRCYFVVQFWDHLFSLSLFHSCSTHASTSGTPLPLSSFRIGDKHTEDFLSLFCQSFLS